MKRRHKLSNFRKYIIQSTVSNNYNIEYKVVVIPTVVMLAGKES